MLEVLQLLPVLLLLCTLSKESARLIGRIGDVGGDGIVFEFSSMYFPICIVAFGHFLLVIRLSCWSLRLFALLLYKS